MRSSPAPTISSLLHSCPGLATYWHMCKCCVTYLLTYLPQGSVLGPILFILYVAGAINIADKHGFAAHSYADDLQIYDHSPQSSCSSLVVRMSNCVAEINEWMGSNRLKLNPSKTELIWLGSSRRLEHCPVGELNIAAREFPSSRLRTSVTSAL